MSEKGRILVVDDEPVIRRCCERTLQDEGFEVTLVPCGEAAFPALRSAEYDAVLLDVMMPGMGGIEVLELVRTEWPDLPIVIITGYATPDQKEMALAHGATAWLPKPFGPPELLAALEKVKQR